MSTTYWKVATNYKTYFHYLSPTTNLPVTGVAAGSFTVELTKNGTGHQASTGITGPTEIDAVNNAGDYWLDISGSTSFLSATGVYELVVYRSSDKTRVWTESIVVTSDGTAAGTWGDASWTPTIGDGRLVAGGVALSGATVKILNSSGVLYLQTTSDASGLYPTLYFPSGSATYTISAQKSGYTIATGTITTASSTATGPLADLSLTLSTTSTGLLTSDLQAYARRMMTGNTGSLSDTITLEAVNEALMLLSQLKQWPYLSTYGTITTDAAYATGTVTMTNASPTVTLASGTWPTWAANGELYVNSGEWYTVLTRDSASQLTLNTNFAGTTSSGMTYTLGRHKYALPSDIMRMDAVMPGPNWPYGRSPASAARLQMIKDLWQSGEQYPNMWAVQGDQFYVWPWPTQNHRVNLLYFRRPALLVSGTDTADWDPMQLLVLHRAIDYAVALRGECVAGDQKTTYQSLQVAIDLALPWDKTTTDMQLHSSNEFYDTFPIRGTITG